MRYHGERGIAVIATRVFHTANNGNGICNMGGKRAKQIFATKARLIKCDFRIFLL